MNYRYLRHSEINFSRWDACIHASDNGNIYSLSWYLDIVSPGWDGIVCIEGEEYVLVMAIPHFRRFNFLKSVQQPPFVNQLGAIHRVNLDISGLKKILSELRKFDSVHSYPLNLENQELMNDISVLEGLQVTINGSYQLDLSRNYSDLFKHFSSDRRTNIKRSERNNLVLLPSENIDELIELHKKFNAPKVLGGVSAKQYSILKQLYHASYEKGFSQMFAVKFNDQTIAMCLFYFFKNRIIKFCNVSTNEGRRLNGDSFMTHKLLSKWSGQPKIFDFERMNSEGVNHYKKSYGAELVFYPTLNRDNLPRIIKVMQKIRRRFIGVKENP